MLNITIRCLGIVVVVIMKTPKTSNSSRRVVVVVIVALLIAATTIVTVVGMAIPIVVKPAYAQLDDISREQIVGEIEIPDSDDIKEKAREIIASQAVPTLPELGTALIGARGPPVLAG
jgi:hypothetical protein